MALATPVEGMALAKPVVGMALAKPVVAAQGDGKTSRNQHATHMYDTEESAARLAFGQPTTRMYDTKESAARVAFGHSRGVPLANVLNEGHKRTFRRANQRREPMNADGRVGRRPTSQ